MKMTSRELNLLGATLMVLVLAGIFWFTGPQRAEWTAYAEKRADLEDRLEKAERLAGSRGEVEARLAEFRDGLPVFAEGRRAESELMPALDRLAAQYQLQLPRRRAEEEKAATGDLFETTISGDWEGDLEALVNFLYAQQSQGMVSDIRQLSVQPVSGSAAGGRLKGNFSMDYAYRREAGAPDETNTAGTETPPAEGAEP